MCSKDIVVYDISSLHILEYGGKTKLSHKRQMTLLGQNHAHPVFKNRTFERMHTFLRPLPRICPITAAL